MSLQADFPARLEGSTSSTQGTPIKKGKCFKCGKQGHWAADCHQKATGFSQRNLSRGGAAAATAGGNRSGEVNFSEIICRCGAGVCEPRVAKTNGKVYYRCPAESWMSCDFFMWHHKLDSSSIKRLQYPICDCSAGICVLGREAGTGREYFKCRVPKGHGACSFRLWLDAPVSTSTSAPRLLGIQANRPLVGEDDSGGKCLKNTELEGSPITNSAWFSSNSMDSLADSNTKEGLVMSPMELEDLSHEILREIMENKYPLVEDDKSSQWLKITEFEESPVNTSAQLSPSSSGKEVSMLNATDLEPFYTDEDLINEVITFESTISNASDPGEISYDYQMEKVLETAPAKYHNNLRLRQVNFAGTDFSVENSLSLMLGAQYLGWLSRLAFVSPRCLVLPLRKHWLCCIFPNFDPICVPQALGQFDDKAQPVSTLGKSLALPQESVVGDDPAIILKEPSGLGSLPYFAESDNVTAAAIMEAFGQAAVLIQNNFLTRLESMSPACHESMVKEANTVFASLDHLKVDYRLFYQRSKDFIDAAASLNQIELSICNDVSFQDYLDRCNHEKLRLEQLSSEHASVMNSVTRSQKCLQSLQIEADEVRNKLLQIEQQVSACKLITKDLQIRLAEISEQMNDCEDNLQRASLEAGAAQKLAMQKETELSAAWDVFQKAKLQLRNKASLLSPAWKYL